jgi:hypothetical protein
LNGLVSAVARKEIISTDPRQQNFNSSFPGGAGNDVSAQSREICQRFLYAPNDGSKTTGEVRNFLRHIQRNAKMVRD